MKLSQLVKQAVSLDKNTENDKRSILSDAVSSSFTVDGERAYTHLCDYDDDFVYFEIYSRCSSGYHTHEYSYWKHPYTYSGSSATMGDGEAVEVVRLTEWKEVSSESESDSDDTMTKSWLLETLKKYVGPTQKEQVIIKQFDDEQMIAIEPLYVAAGITDAHGDEVASHDVTKGMVDSLNKALEGDGVQTGLFHKHLTSGFTIEKAWVNEVECMIGDTLVAEGQPLVKIQFTSESLWKQRKDGNLCGLSIGARGLVEDLIDE